MPWKPAHPGELPTLGIIAIHWITANCIVPDGPAAGEPLVLTREQVEFILRLYAVDPNFKGPPIVGRSFRNGRIIRRAVLSRPKGWGKSPLMAALTLFEGLGPAVLDGWDANGRPVGRPWNSLGFKPKAQIVAVSEDQTANTWDPLLDMAREGPVADNYDIEALDTFINVPRGRIDFTTSSPRSREGFRPVFAVMDQTESWTPEVRGDRLAATIRRNLSKTNGLSIETPNAYVPGENSIAEQSHEAWRQQESGKYPKLKGLLYDHREAPGEVDLGVEKELVHGLRVAYGDSSDHPDGCLIHTPPCQPGWASIDRIKEEIWDLATDESDARRFYLNQVSAAEDAWLAPYEWNACGPIEDEDGTLAWHDGSGLDDKRPKPGDVITAGFDGSRMRKKGVTDATALIGCRLSDGHIFTIKILEQPPDWPRGKEWEVPRHEVDAAVDHMFATFHVVGFYADPAKWETHVARWEAKYGRRLKVKASQKHPIEWWMTGARSARIVQMLDQFHSAVLDQLLTHDGSERLTAHVINARRHPTRSGMQIRKEHPDSPKKIDGAVAASLAWQCRLDAIAQGVGRRQKRVLSAPKRIR